MDEGSAVKKNLLDRLLSSVKQVQIYFGARQEIATETDLRVSTLCSEWEAVLVHGLKKTKPKGLAGIGKSESSGNIWSVAKLSLSPEEVQRFVQLKNVTTDVGRGRAWLRAAINERTLENYMHLLLAQEDSLKTLYEPYALLLDQECGAMLPVMAAGLSSIIFSIPTDAEYLNSTTRFVDVPAQNLIPAAAAPSMISSPLTPYQPPMLPQLNYLNSSQSPAILNKMQLVKGDDDDDDVVAVHAKEKKKKRKKKSTTSSTPSSGGDSTQPSTSRSPSVSPAPPLQNSELYMLDEDESFAQHNYNITPTLQENEGRSLFDELQEVGAQPQDSISTSSSHMSLNSATEESSGTQQKFVMFDEVTETEAATNALLSLMSTQEQAGMGMPGADMAGTSRDMTSEEMKKSLVSMVKSKDEIDERNRQLEKQLHEVQQSRTQLIVELGQYQTQMTSLQESHARQLEGLERENDLLHDQLKRYVGMVQGVRKESSAKGTEGAAQSVLSSGSSPPKETEAESQTSQASSRPRSPSVDQKLTEMAEMYGDLMELNGRLHKDISAKDSVICKLVRSLRQAGLQVPVPAEHLPPAALEPEMLVNVWIPSVIKKGRGPDTHHVYQIFIRVKTEEWNVYRRYNEFREFHRQLQHYTIDVNSFSFPPKKAIGNKSLQVVEERRQRLQDYLRFVFKVCSSKPLAPKDKKSKKQKLPLQPIIQSNITKATLVTMFPFFKEDLHSDAIATRTHPPPPRSPSYSGL